MKIIGLIFQFCFVLVARGLMRFRHQLKDWSGLVKLEGVDFMGGDIRRLEETASASFRGMCGRIEMFAFTYAKPTHKKASKQRSCWLKKSGFKYGRNLQYTSGIKVN